MLYNSLMDSPLVVQPDRIRGYVVILFIIWFIIALFGVVKAVVHPQQMAVLGPLGDWFGVFNPLLGLATVLATLLNLHYLTVQVVDQRTLAQDQKLHDLKSLLREKLEIIVIDTRRYIEICVGNTPLTAEEATLDWHNRFTIERIAAMAGPEMLTRLYFPTLEPHVKAIMDANEAFTKSALEVATKENGYYKTMLGASLAEKTKNIGDAYQEFFVFVMKNAEQIIDGARPVIEIRRPTKNA